MITEKYLSVLSIVTNDQNKSISNVHESIDRDRLNKNGLNISYKILQCNVWLIDLHKHFCR